MAANSPQRTIYLVTYSQADLSKFPSRESFSVAILNGFEARNVQVVMWVTSLEHHQNAGCHYHMALKLASKSRWLKVRAEVLKNHAINVNFREQKEGNTYYSAYQYVTKADGEFIASPGHPEMTALPRTEKAIAAKKAAHQQIPSRKRRREERMSDFDLLKIVQQRKFTSRLQIFSLAANLQAEGNDSLARFIANRGSKCIENALMLAKELKEAPVQLQRQSKTRLELLRAFLDGPCVAECDEQWLRCAIEVVQQNGIELAAFATAVYQLLKLGRGKYRNIFIHGPANCGKSFLLQPLKLVFKIFLNPAHGTFAWVGVDECEVIFLNDFRWSPTLIAWETLLVLLEGDITHLPAPKKLCHKDIEIQSDVPIFATSDMPIVFAKGGTIDMTNTRMMEVRWRSFNLWKVIPESERKELQPCARCFAQLVLGHQSATEPEEEDL